MSVWLILLIGLIIGWIIGVFIVRQNYETCKKNVEQLKQELAEKEAKLHSVKDQRERLEQELQDKETVLQEIAHD